MNRRQTFYKLIACVSMIYILYVLVNNFVVDPGAETFLSHKAGLEYELKPRIWLMVMYIHAGFACIAMGSGLINCSRRSYEKHRGFHRVNGCVYVSSVLIAVLTSGYMAPYATGGKISSIGFNVLNILWLVITATALVHIFKKRILQHRRWMIRSYAFCYTNMLIHLLTFVFHQIIGFAYVTSYTIGLYGSMVLLMIAPEVLFRVKKPKCA
ncbi:MULTISPECIES: DUF2306 domain-containing protein [Paenibacillus]|uniref:Uncharacterized protein n=1 Tax=Paenibacillus naphthalenovorans TaxID=162209 RepID=A0A0U2KYI8_9BACL|nr:MULTISPECIES: DUF2306 domain-containing protein [Paenibacillus]ALS21986.1 hypothetical protein IJ22_16100 [Paenibacillus naphthalenovorans]GCL74203.1 DUF2306 domain-containing protein [Paenibacillus naphthalenovorans]SDJ23475.1 Predicted membrane protein [Paenibacillus naphthalenovorans]